MTRQLKFFETRRVILRCIGLHRDESDRVIRLGKLGTFQAVGPVNHLPDFFDPLSDLSACLTAAFFWTTLRGGATSFSDLHSNLYAHLHCLQYIHPMSGESGKATSGYLTCTTYAMLPGVNMGPKK